MLHIDYRRTGLVNDRKCIVIDNNNNRNNDSNNSNNNYNTNNDLCLDKHKKWLHAFYLLQMQVTEYRK